MSIDALLRHLEEDAARESDRLRQEAEGRAAALLARADADAARRRELHLERVAEQRRTAGERQVAAARAQARAQFLAVRAGVLERVFEEAAARLQAMPAARYASILEALAEDAARYLENAPAVLQSPPDAARALAVVVRDRPGVRVEPADLAAGVVGRSADGRVMVDNTLAAMLERRRPDLAIALSARIEGN